MKVLILNNRDWMIEEKCYGYGCCNYGNGGGDGCGDGNIVSGCGFGVGYADARQGFFGGTGAGCVFGHGDGSGIGYGK
jgi:hypothetical protein